MFDLFWSGEKKKKRTLTTAQLKDFKAAIGKCEVCNSKQSIRVLEVHHIKPISEGGTDSFQTNLIVLCPTCHRKAHSGEITRAELRKAIKKRSKKAIAEIKAIQRRKQKFSRKAKAEDPFGISSLEVSIPEIKIPDISISDPFNSSSSKKNKKRGKGKGRKKRDDFDFGFDLF